MSVNQLRREIQLQADTEWKHLPVNEIARLRAQYLVEHPVAEIFLDHDTRRTHAAIGIQNALEAKRYLLGHTDAENFRIDFFPGHPYHRETQAYHGIQLDAFEKLLGTAFKKEIVYDESTGIYSPATAVSDRQIVRSEFFSDSAEEPYSVRFADAEQHALLASQAGHVAISSIARA
ncbi:MAG: hypothetical protein QFB87_03795 [Patescibacteria group bacterium]|nr:hypothetical protein [Patescibacteria group bacterium]